MNETTKTQEVREELQSFLKLFQQYRDEIFGESRNDSAREHLIELRQMLQRQEPRVSGLIVQIIGDGSVTLNRMRISHRDLLPSALMGGNNEMRHNFREFASTVTALLNRSVGTIDAGMWPQKTLAPVLTINDRELRDRCAPLLALPGNYDTVTRETTTILEDRIQRKPPYGVLTCLIPVSGDQIGNNLIDKLFSPGNLVLRISDDRCKQIAFHQILKGAFLYLRNQYHHRVDPSTEWSWAWSTVGFIDKLLAEIDGCSVVS